MTIFATSRDPNDTDQFAVGEGTRNLTRFGPFPPVSYLTRPDQTDVLFVVEPLPQREFVLMPDQTLTLLPFVEADPMPVVAEVAPEGHVGRHRRPEPWWAWLAVAVSVGFIVGGTMVGAILRVLAALS